MMTARRRIEAALGGLLMGLLLASCGPQALDSSAAFQSGGEDALVVMGTALEGDGVRPWRGKLVVIWTRYDPAQPETIDQHFGVESETAVQAQFLWPKDWVRDLTTMRHSVHRLPPGDYVLSRVAISHLHEAQVTWFLAPERSALERRMLHDPETLAGSDAPRVRVNAGEIVYIGDFLFAPSHPDERVGVWRTEGVTGVWSQVPDLRVRIADWQADEAAAARTLEAFQRVQGQATLRRPAGLPEPM